MLLKSYSLYFFKGEFKKREQANNTIFKNWRRSLIRFVSEYLQ